MLGLAHHKRLTEYIEIEKDEWFIHGIDWKLAIRWERCQLTSDSQTHVI